MQANLRVIEQGNRRSRRARLCRRRAGQCENPAEPRPGASACSDRQDPNQQVLTNLIRNSIEAMHAAERRELSLQRVWTDPIRAGDRSRHGPRTIDEIKNRLFQPSSLQKTMAWNWADDLPDNHRCSWWKHLRVHDDNPDGAAFCFRLPLASYSEDSA